MTDLRGRRVLILGLARQGTALARYLVTCGAHVIVSDALPATAPELAEALQQVSGLPLQLALGGHPLSLLDGTDLVCLSGGVPPDLPIVQAARARGIPLSNDSLLTLQHCPGLTIGISGSSGKTTTTTLVGEMLAAAGLPVWVGGNIGTPLIDRLAEIAETDRVVLELSSFQLELFDSALCLDEPVSPQVAGLLNVTPNHLDRHPSMATYAEAKYNLLGYQQAGDVAVLGLDNDITAGWWQELARDVAQSGITVWGFSLQQAPTPGAFLKDGHLMLRVDAGPGQSVCRVEEIRLRGMHNVSNLLAACCLSAAGGAGIESMRGVATTFQGVAHRLELVGEWRGSAWYNDSIATAPERTIAALRSFDEPIVLLAGGRDKQLPWVDFAAAVRHHVRHVITFGEAAPLIERALAAYEAAHPQAPGHAPSVQHADDLAAAVILAAGLVQAGDVVLLSPGGTSYDAYRDFAARGDHFRALVDAL